MGDAHAEGTLQALAFLTSRRSAQDTFTLRLHSVCHTLLLRSFSRAHSMMTASSTGAVRLNSSRTLLVLDWDGTVAATDTLSLIAPSPDALKPYTEAYMADHKKLSDSFGPRDTLPGMAAWLAAMEEVEFVSVKRVEDGGLFKGMPKREMLDRAADTSKLDLQKGALDMLQSFQGHWGIVSVGWSAIFIRQALESRGIDFAKTKKDVAIVANEVEFDGNDTGTGRISKHQGNERGIRIARDKRREMRELVREWKSSDDAGEDDLVAYVGDSETDLLCMLEADVGIIINSESMMAKCEKLGIEVTDGLENIRKRTPQDDRPTLRSVKDFTPFLRA